MFLVCPSRMICVYIKIFYNDLSYSYFTHVYVCVSSMCLWVLSKARRGYQPFELELRPLIWVLGTELGS